MTVILEDPIGVPLTIRLRLVSANSGRPVTGHAVHLWQRDAGGTTDLHGVQPGDESGWVTFTSVFPGVGPVRWPHLRLEIQPSAWTSRLTLPRDVCHQAYATAGYAASRHNLAACDPAFTDGGPLEIASVTGDTRRGFVATRTVKI
ncbi:MAG: hypothetical protein ABW046_21665 [Actinoplanes sp.]